MTEYESSKAINQSLFQYIDPEQGGSPAKFKHALENKADSEEQYYRLGRHIHSYILESKKFMTLSTKGMTVKGVQIAEIIWNNLKFDLLEGVILPEDAVSDDDTMLSLVKEFSYGRGKDATRIQSLKSEVIPYLQQRLMYRDKILVSDAELKTIMECASSLKSNESTNLWLSSSSTESMEILDELEIFWEFNISGEKMDLKSKLDRLILDHENRKITILDIKTTGKPVDLFTESIAKFRYDRQLAFYIDAAKFYVKNTLGLKEYTFTEEVRIAAVETFGLYESRLFKFKVAELEHSRKNYIDILERIQWHRNTNEWKYPRGLENSGIYKGTYNVNLIQAHE